MGSSTPRNVSPTRSTQAWEQHRAPTSTQRPETFDVNVGGLRIAVTRRQADDDRHRPLLLINGIGATGALFDPFVDVLEPFGGRDIITFDAPGVGLSSTPTYPPTIRQLARLIAGLVEEVSDRQVDVLGLS